MIRTVWLVFVLLGICASTAAATAEQSQHQRRPNIIFFLLDDLGWRDLGCYGSQFYETPNIDQLANESVRFTNAYAACHVCSPTRASILTGKYPARLKLTDWLPGRRNFPFQRLENGSIRQQLSRCGLTEETMIIVFSDNGGMSAANFGQPGHGMQSPGGAIRVGDYKLLEYFENQSVQLFHLGNDPGEQQDLAAERP